MKLILHIDPAVAETEIVVTAREMDDDVQVIQALASKQYAHLPELRSNASTVTSPDARRAPAVSASSRLAPRGIVNADLCGVHSYRA
ncbi:MAG: hypothetical protein PUK59_00155 [Actinomycetaceae bacterium]|nr:hypothetical protein [Actinomycetaceae bacterium]MDY5854248.1 hypothetical protein [Arcanobacterium sp.]